jgi:uncharacterized membrane protein
VTRKNLAIAAAIVFGAFVRFWRIGALSVWFDEGYTAWVIDHPCRQIIALLRADTAPPLYYLLLHCWCAMLGRSEIAMRSFSALLGIATIPLVAGIANRLLIKPSAVVAATWIFVLSFPQTWYSQEARGYELTAFLVALMLYSLVRHLNRPRWIWLGLFIAAAVAGIYVNDIMPFYVVAIGLAALILPGVLTFKQRLRDGLPAALFLVAAYLPWLGTLKSQLHRVNQDFWIPSPTFDSTCNVLSQLCGIGHFWSWDQYVHGILPNVATEVPRLMMAALVIGIITSLFLLRGRERRTMIALIVAALFAPLAIILYSEFQRPIFFMAPLLPSTAILPLVLASPLVWPWKKAGGMCVIIIVLLCAVNLWAYEKERDKEDWRSAAAAVAQMPPVQHRLIIFVANEAQLPFDYYYHLRAGEIETGAPAGFFDINPPRTQIRVLSNAQLDGLKAKLISGNFDDVVLVDSHAGWIDPDGFIHDGYSDPQGLTAQLVIGMTQPIERVDIPQDISRHAITIWRCRAK